MQRPAGAAAEFLLSLLSWASRGSSRMLRLTQLILVSCSSWGLEIRSGYQRAGPLEAGRQAPGLCPSPCRLAQSLGFWDSWAASQVSASIFTWPLRGRLTWPSSPEDTNRFQIWAHPDGSCPK